MKSYLLNSLLLVFLLLFVNTAHAQRGVGDAVGLSARGVTPDVVTISGSVVDLKIAPCEMSTGPSLVGAHVILADAERGEINLHLGPATEVGDVVSHLQKGDAVVAAVFRTDKLPADQFIARDLQVDDQQFVLRDATLRPVWAGSAQGLNGRGRSGPGMRGGRGPRF